MSGDAILDTISVGAHRVFLFCVGAALIAAALWVWVMMKVFDMPFNGLKRCATEAWPPVTNWAAAVLFWQPVVIGVLTMAVIYLLLGRWWKKRGDVHRRGARFDDREV